MEMELATHWSLSKVHGEEVKKSTNAWHRGRGPPSRGTQGLGGNRNPHTGQEDFPEVPSGREPTSKERLGSLFTAPNAGVGCKPLLGTDLETHAAHRPGRAPRSLWGRGWPQAFPASRGTGTCAVPGPALGTGPWAALGRKPDWLATAGCTSSSGRVRIAWQDWAGLSLPGAWVGAGTAGCAGKRVHRTTVWRSLRPEGWHRHWGGDDLEFAAPGAWAGPALGLPRLSPMPVFLLLPLLRILFVINLRGAQPAAESWGSLGESLDLEVAMDPTPGSESTDLLVTKVPARRYDVHSRRAAKPTHSQVKPITSGSQAEWPRREK